MINMEAVARVTASSAAEDGWPMKGKLSRSVCGGRLDTETWQVVCYGEAYSQRGS